MTKFEGIKNYKNDLEFEFITNEEDAIENSKEIFSNAEMVVKVKEPEPEEVAMCHTETTMFTYFHFAANETLTKAFLNSGATAIAYETIMLSDRSLPLLIPMSEVAGRMSVQEGAKFLKNFMEVVENY